MAKTTTVRMGSKTYVVHELPRNKNRAWLQNVLSPLEGAKSTFGEIWGADTAQVDRQQVAERVFAVGKQLIGMISTDHMLELMYAYSPELTAAREAIESDDELYDSEVVDAFVQVLALATPFGQTLTKVRGLIARGVAAISTSAN